MNQPVLQVAELSLSYGPTPVIARLTLSLGRGESVAIMGPSGSGKSSLLACITGMILPTQGRVQVAEHVMSDLNSTDRAQIRREHLGLVFQSPDLLPELSVAENVAIILLLDGEPRAQALARAELLLDQVGVAEYRDQATDKISGGQAQRVAVARALARPGISLIIADEPTASLDARNASLVTQTLIDGAKNTQAGLLLATHDLAVAQACDRIVDLSVFAAEATAA